MAIKILDSLAAEGIDIHFLVVNTMLIQKLLDVSRKIIATPNLVKAYLETIESIYQSGEYMDELDNLENIVDTLLQVIMDDGNRLKTN